jgi:hypothetical protein
MSIFCPLLGAARLGVVRPLRALLILTFAIYLCSCDPTGERRFQIQLLPATTGYSTAQQLAIAETIVDKMAQQHHWLPEAVSSAQRRRGTLPLYTIHLGDSTMHCQLLALPHEIQLYFTDWSSLREANEAYRRMGQFDREFHEALAQPRKT